MCVYVFTVVQDVESKKKVERGEHGSCSGLC